jgi:hypothetical protein
MLIAALFYLSDPNVSFPAAQMMAQGNSQPIRKHQVGLAMHSGQRKGSKWAFPWCETLLHWRLEWRPSPCSFHVTY